MRLQVLVPHWQETPEEARPLLDSLAIQQGVDMGDLGVVIAYDGPEASELPLDEWRARYPFEILDVHPGKGGVSATRNAALDAATADYVMFCDADDLFCDVCGLYIVFREMGIGEFDTLVSCFREQTKAPDGSLVFVDHRQDQTFVHGKVHRRRYLVDNGIRFDPALTVHEDSYFNIQCQALAGPGRMKYCQTPFYLWRWRDDSVCRHDRDYILRTYVDMIASNDALVGQFVRRLRDDLAGQYVAFMVWDVYYTLNCRRWRDVTNAEYRERTERRFAQYLGRHRDRWESVPQDVSLAVSNGVRQRHIADGDMMVEDLTMGQWVTRIEETYPDETGVA